MGAILQMRYMDSLKGRMASMTVPDEIVAALANPARMIEIKSLLFKTYGASDSGQATSLQLIDHIKYSLVYALHGVFLLGALVAMLGLITNFFVRERELRSRAKPAPVQAKQEREPDSGQQ